MPASNASDPARCPVCGKANRCASLSAQNSDQPCWCFGVTISSKTLNRSESVENRNACLCQQCAQASADADADAP